jgi:hypothetical protein
MLGALLWAGVRTKSNWLKDTPNAFRIGIGQIKKILERPVTKEQRAKVACLVPTCSGRPRPEADFHLRGTPSWPVLDNLVANTLDHPIPLAALSVDGDTAKHWSWGIRSQPSFNLVAVEKYCHI